MSSKYVRDQVKAFLDANWVATIIAGAENEFEEPPGSLVPWLTYGFGAEGEQQMSIGNPGGNCFEEPGEVRVTVFVASGTGIEEALTYAESVRTMFRGVQLGQVRFTTVDPPDTSFPSSVQSSMGNWFGYQVVARYVYNYAT